MMTEEEYNQLLCKKIDVSYLEDVDNQDQVVSDIFSTIIVQQKQNELRQKQEIEKPWYEFFNEERPYDEIVNFINQYIVEDQMAKAKKYAYEIEPARIFDLIKQNFQEHQFSELSKQSIKNVTIRLCSHAMLKATLKDNFLKNLETFQNQQTLEEQEILISFSGGEFLADFTGINLYWKQLQKNLTKMMLGLQNYKLPKQRIPDTEAKRHKHAKSNMEIERKYDFSKSCVVHDFFSVYLTILKTRVEAQDEISQEW